jgi:hypothetical protein
MEAGSEQEMLRAARNQALYREVNEQVEALNEAFDELLDAASTWICECADTECNEPMEFPLAEYEAVRAHPNRFAVLPGHVYPEVEHVVEEHDGYVVVAKVGAGATFAAQHDPRVAKQASRP